MHKESLAVKAHLKQQHLTEIKAEAKLALNVVYLQTEKATLLEAKTVKLLKLAKVQHIGMVNILAENEIVPELLQQDFTPERLAEEAILLLKDQDRRVTMIGHLKQIRSLLGKPGAYQRAAEILVDQLKPA